MATTDANGIAFAETTDAVSPLHTLLNLLQQSTSDAVSALKTRATTGETQVTNLGTEVTASATTTQTGTIGTPYIYTAAEITLTAGTWLVFAEGSVKNVSVADTVAIELWDQTNSVSVANSRGVAGLTNTTASTPLATRTKVITVTASTVYRVRGVPNGGSTVQFISAAAAPAVWLQATRLK